MSNGRRVARKGSRAHSGTPGRSPRPAPGPQRSSAQSIDDLERIQSLVAEALGVIRSGRAAKPGTVWVRTRRAFGRMQEVPTQGWPICSVLSRESSASSSHVQPLYLLEEGSFAFDGGERMALEDVLHGSWQHRCDMSVFVEGLQSFLSA